MLVVDLKVLGKEVGPAFNFLTQHLEEPLKLKGNQVQLKSINAHTARLLLRKYLRQRGLEDYRVVVTHSGLVQIFEPRSKKKPSMPEEINLFPKNETIPYYQTAAEMGGIVPKPGRRKWKP